MRNLLALGIVSSVVFAGMAACGDDETGNRPGLGGSGGSAGSAGGAGMSGTSGAGGIGGSTARGGSSGSSSAPPPDVSPQAMCTGCIELIAPVVGPRSPNNGADEASYIFALGAPVDFSNALITWRIAAVEPNANYNVVLFAQNGQLTNFAGAYSETALNPATFAANQFRDIVLDLRTLASASGDAGAPDAAAPNAGDAGEDAGDAGEQPVTPVPNVIGAFDTTQVIQFGIFVGVNEAFNGSATVRVAVDQVTVSGVTGQTDRTFTDRH